jgi:hypothetical protein
MDGKCYNRIAPSAFVMYVPTDGKAGLSLWELVFEPSLARFCWRIRCWLILYGEVR